MLTGVKIRLMSLFAAAALAVAGCGSSTAGSGSVAPTSAGGSAGTGSSADFPSTPPSAPPTGATTAASATGTPSTANASGSGVPHGTPITTKTVHTPDGPYVVQIWAQVNNKSCAGHAYGKALIAFLKKHPCQRLRRLLGSTTVNGRPVAIAESATSFGSSGGDPYQITGEFTQLEQRDGTGSINDLLREGHRIPQGPSSIPAKEVFKVLSQDNVATIWDAWYLDGPTDANDPGIVKMINAVFLLL